MSEIKYEKQPPVGLRPRWIVVESRINEIIEAMERYSVNNYAIPEKWLVELSDLIVSDRHLKCPIDSCDAIESFTQNNKVSSKVDNDIETYVQKVDKYNKETVASELECLQIFRFGNQLYVCISNLDYRVTGELLHGSIIGDVIDKYINIKAPRIILDPAEVVYIYDTNE